MGHLDRTVPDADPNNRPVDVAEGRSHSRSAQPTPVGLHRHRRRHHRVLRLLQGGQDSAGARARVPDLRHLGMVLDAVHRRVDCH